MNKFLKIAVMTLALAVTAKAEIKGVGYDSDLKQISVRLPLGANLLDVGGGIKFDNSQDSSYAKFQISASGFFLGHLHDFGPVDTYFTAGGVLTKLPADDDNISLSAFVGFQPEVTLLEHIVVSTRVGLDIALLPEFIFQSAGKGLSIVEGANFKILF